MKATIWHNPRCSKSREALAILNDTPGVEVEVIDYLNQPPSRDELKALYAAAGLTPREGCVPARTPPSRSRARATTRVASAAEATTEAADLEAKAVDEEKLRDLGAPERARGFRVEAVAASNKADRHAELAAGYRQAADDAAHALTGYRDLQTALDNPQTPQSELTALAAEAADRVEVFEASSEQAMPVKDLLETGVPTGPPLLVPAQDINRVLAAQGIEPRLDGQTPQPIPTAEYRRLMSADGMVIPIGDGLAQARLRMKRRDFTEIAGRDRDYDLAEQMSGTIGAGSRASAPPATRPPVRRTA